MKGACALEEEILLKELIENPNVGIRKIIDKYGGLIYSMTKQRLSGKLKKEDIEECVNDIFLELFKARNKIDLKRGSMKNYLIRIAQLKSYTYYSRKTEKLETISFDSVNGSIAADESTDPLNIIISRENGDELLSAVLDLGKPTSTMIILKYYYGLKAREIGKITGHSKNAVEKRIKNGLNKIRRLIS